MAAPGNAVRRAIAVLLVEDHTLMVEALMSRIERDGGMSVVGSASSVTEAIAQYEATRPDVVLCDVGLPDDHNGGIKVTRRLVADFGARVLMYSGHVDRALVAAALDAGAAGYVRKTASRHELVDCVEAVVAGQSNVFDRATAGDLVHASRTPRTSFDELTARQREVLQYMVDGVVQTTQLAAAMQVSEQTVKSHVEAVLRKLGVTRRSQAVVIAVNKGMRSSGAAQ